MSLSPSKSMVFLASFLFATPAFAGYEYPLQTAEIRNAYFLGERNNSQTAEFFAAYGHLIGKPQTGDYIISEVDVLTPYEQIVQRGARNIPGDSALQTEGDLAAHPLKFVVKVTVVYSNFFFTHVPASSDTWKISGHDFSVEAQQEHKLTSLKMARSEFGGEGCPCGVLITTEFDPAKITSAPMHITVRTPDGQSLSTDFDLSKLK